MQAQLLMLSAAGLLLASTAHAAPSAEVRRFIDQTEAAADARLAERGVDLQGRTAAVRVTVGGDGRLYGVQVVRSTGSRETDDAIEDALRKLRVKDAPAMLSGAQVTLPLGEAPTSAASTGAGDAAAS
jgi:TonB family protein